MKTRKSALQERIARSHRIASTPVLLKVEVRLTGRAYLALKHERFAGRRPCVSEISSWVQSLVDLELRAVNGAVDGPIPLSIRRADLARRERAA